jgi:hypothetical protein
VNAPTVPTGWAQQWVGQRLGVLVHPVSSSIGVGADQLVGLAVRRNPRRAHLLVSRVLGKHVPTDPRVVYGSGLLLGLLAADALAGSPPQGSRHEHRALGAALARALPGGGGPARAFATAVEQAVQARVHGPSAPPSAPLVLGYAETAVGLGHALAEAIPGAVYLHSTRRVSVVGSVGGFEEEHSHATSHLLCPADPGLLLGSAAAARPLVLVDDELTTGRTILNTIRALHRHAPRPQYVVATLLDMRSAEDARTMADTVAALGARLDVVSLAAGRVTLPPTLLEDASTLLAGLPPDQPAPRRGARDWQWLAPAVPGLVETGRHGIDATQRRALPGLLAQVGAGLEPAPGERLLVLGTEELMAAPVLLACHLADVEPAATVRFSTTTRSPAVAVDDTGYALTSALRFRCPEQVRPGEDETRHAYNVLPAAGQPGWNRILLVTDTPAAGERLSRDGSTLPCLLSALRPAGARLDVLVLPVHTPEGHR